MLIFLLYIEYDLHLLNKIIEHGALKHLDIHLVFINILKLYEI